jgi:outer membrane lipoprotein-sorting protein
LRATKAAVYRFGANCNEFMTIRNPEGCRKQLLKTCLFFILPFVVMALIYPADAQNDCAEGDGILDTTPPKDIGVPELIQKFTAEETKVKEARSHYTYTQDLMVQTLNDKNTVDGQMHQVATISYDDKGKRIDNVTYAEQSTLRGVQLSAQDMDDVRTFMPLILSTDELPQYTLTYAGQQHVDDLDTYVFHVVPKSEEKNKRYFEGRVWVDNHDFQIVKLCGKSVPETVHAKKNQPQEIRPMFVGYRQPVDGNWFPAYARVDDTLHFRAESVHVREIVKFTGYKRAGTATGAKP